MESSVEASRFFSEHCFFNRSLTVEMLAAELHTTSNDILRKIDFLERSKIIRRVATSYPKSESLRTAGMPEGGFKNMGVMWEVIK